MSTDGSRFVSSAFDVLQTFHSTLQAMTLDKPQRVDANWNYSNVGQNVGCCHFEVSRAAAQEVLCNLYDIDMARNDAVARLWLSYGHWSLRGKTRILLRVLDTSEVHRNRLDGNASTRYQRKHKTFGLQSQVY